MSLSKTPASDPLQRFSVSMPLSVTLDLDRMAGERGFANRSQAITAAVRDCVLDHDAEKSSHIMMGLISFIYEHRQRNLQNRLSDIQHRHLKEIITVQLVHLEHDLTLQVLVVQGPVKTLRVLSNSFSSLKGVRHARLNLSSDLLPPLHQP